MTIKFLVKFFVTFRCLGSVGSFCYCFHEQDGRFVNFDGSLDMDILEPQCEKTVFWDSDKV